MNTALRRTLAVCAAGLLCAATAFPAAARVDSERRGADRHHIDRHDRHGDGHSPSLRDVRRATARFHSIRAAERAGYQLGYMAPFPLDGCIAHPTDGAMGYHWFDHEAIADPGVDARHPEALVYAPDDDGRLRLAAVEWVVPKSVWEAAGNTAPPTLFDHELHILNQALGWYVLHAWVWMPNPSGTFADWNPEVVCPS